MKREFLTELGLEKDVVDKILNQHGSELTVLKTQLTTKDTEISTLRGDLTTANAKVADLEKVDVKELQRQLDDEKNGRIKDKKDFALKSILTQNGCKDVDYAIYKLGEKVEFDENGGIKDAESFIKSTKEAYANLFTEDSPGGTGGSGNFGRGSSGGFPTKEELLKKPYSERNALYEQNPEEYNKIMKG